VGDFDAYLHEIEKNLRRGNATEQTYRSALKSLFESLGPHLTAVNEPKQIECGAPDFIVLKKDVPLGHVEAKDIGKNLGEIEKDEQLTRYREALPNLILTDYLEFRWYVDGGHRLTARLASPGSDGRLKRDGHDEALLRDLLEGFLTVTVPTVKSPKELASRMAAKARLIREIIAKAIASEPKGGLLRETMEGLRRILISDLKEAQFADIYAQTICYGLFAARCNHKGPDRFARKTAGYDLPRTNPFLREFFDNLAGLELDSRVVWAVDDLVYLLNHADIAGILKDFGRRTRREDPVVHFYETFLAEYDPKLRETRGVYYTPEPVVDYIVRSVDHILKTDFGLSDGLADISTVEATAHDGKKLTSPKVLILDPAVGTGTFLHEVVALIHEHETAQGHGGAWSDYVRSHLLPRLFGFEIMMAPYAVCHMKLGLQLKDTGYDFRTNDRLKVYLTNTLEEAHALLDLQLGFAHALMRESYEAAQIKQDLPVMVVLGNPPYSGHSMNKGKWISQLLHGQDTVTGENTGNYFEVDGKPLGEKNPKWLNDDYVKFIRFAQRRIERTGYGILAFITNNGYLDNPTFRGMRKALMDSFDDIYVLDLHGSTKKKERAPDGSKDENVFDIQQGVAIGIFVKRRASTGETTVRHAEIWGPRGEGADGGKYGWLSQHDVGSTQWSALTPAPPLHVFIPRDESLAGEYEQGIRIVEAMPVNVLGFQSHRDNFTLDFDRNSLRKRFEEMRDLGIPDQVFAEKYNVADSGTWKLRTARATIAALGSDWTKSLIDCWYRPFDRRPCFYSEISIDRPRRDLMDHVAGKPNLCLNLVRQTKMASWQHVAASDAPTPAVFVELKDGSSVFPLYLYPPEVGAVGPHPAQRRVNLTNNFLARLSACVKHAFVPEGRGDGKKNFGPEDVFDYIYAILHSPGYRTRYAEFLKSDFPRIPLTSNRHLFWALCEKGEDLVALHLMKKFGPLAIAFPMKGDGKVEKVRYTEPAKKTPGRVWIDKTQYFEGVPPEVWAFHIGGYQVCEKWLKDRKGRTLGYEDIRHYEHIVAALSETIRLMAEIDEEIEKAGGFPLH
jgi:hypothetical protein